MSERTKSSSRFWFGMATLGVLLLAIAGVWSILLPKLELPIFYEDWSAEDFGEYGMLQQRKLHWLLPGPEYLESRISQERFRELETTALGSEISCGPIITVNSPTSTRDGESPFSFADDRSDYRIFLSERLVRELEDSEPQ